MIDEYRAWHKRDKTMYPVVGFKKDLGSCSIWIENKQGVRTWIHEDLVELMRYIQVDDEDGKRVFEGDILALYQKDSWSGNRYKVSKQIVVTRSIKGKINGWNVVVGNHKKVIGNIYETPELQNIKKEKKPGKWNWHY